MSNLQQAISAAVRGAITSVHTALPGEIVSFDTGTGKATVRPTMRLSLAEGGALDYPKIVSVPVVFPRSKDFSLTFPLERGDPVLLLFSERSLDRWLRDGKKNEPGNQRTHDLTDAVAVPGLYPFSEGTRITDPGAVEMQYKKASIRIRANGDIEISGGDAVKKLVTEAFKSVFNDHVHNVNITAFGQYSSSKPALLVGTTPISSLGSNPATFDARLEDSELTSKVRAE